MSELVIRNRPAICVWQVVLGSRYQRGSSAHIAPHRESGEPYRCPAVGTLIPVVPQFEMAVAHRPSDNYIGHGQARLLPPRKAPN